MKLAIAVPTHDQNPAGFTYDLAACYAHTREAYPRVPVQLAPLVATYVHAGREQLAGDLLAWGATHLLWLDSDMRFPPDTFVRLLAHDRPLVGCNCATRYTPSQYTATRNHQRLPTTPASIGLESVDTVGLAVFLMETRVLRALPRPWFFHDWDPATQTSTGEDEYFCQRARAAGHQICIDHDLSHQIGHVGPFTYRLAHCAAQEQNHGRPETRDAEDRHRGSVAAAHV